MTTGINTVLDNTQATIKISELARSSQIYPNSLFIVTNNVSDNYISVTVDYSTLLSNITDVVVSDLMLGTASKYNIGTTAGTVPVLDSEGRIPLALLPDSIIAEPTPGMTYIPSVTFDGKLTWTASTNPPPHITSYNIKGPKGDPGPANSLSIGTVQTGTVAGATITGASPIQTLNLVLPKGDKGDPGDASELIHVSEEIPSEPLEGHLYIILQSEE